MEFQSLIILPTKSSRNLLMLKTIISDASCFIVLSNIGEMELLRNVYSEIVTTPEIVSEFGEKLPEWVIISNVKDVVCQQVLELQLDKGESSAIALALETPSKPQNNFYRIVNNHPLTKYHLNVN